MMRFFIPEWDDRVDPDYDFATDTHSRPSEGRTEARERCDVYAHEIFQRPCYDGVLISKVKIDENRAKREFILEKGAREYLRLPQHLPLMGDCGAFGYIKEELPPYTTDEVIDYYEAARFDIGVSLDHLIVRGICDTLDKCRFRFDLTLENARDFLARCRARRVRFEPMGVAQGWDADSYARAADALQKMGYRSIALGGLVRQKSHQIVEYLERVARTRKPETAVHLFGVARPLVMGAFQNLGVRSFDSASFLRRAWLGVYANYLTPDGSYGALRIPQSDRSLRARRIVESGAATLGEVQALEADALDSLRRFDREQIDLETTLAAILRYDALLGEKRDSYEPYFRRTLENRPWRRCSCPICRDLGVEVIIFRGNNRNRRRGFHNTWVFHQAFTAWREHGDPDLPMFPLAPEHLPMFENAATE